MSIETNRNPNENNILKYNDLVNNRQRPMSVTDLPWVYEIMNKHKFDNPYNVGKWMLFCDKLHLDELWIKISQLYQDGMLPGVISMKCSTNYKNPRASNQSDGVIIIYCNNSHEEDDIMRCGHNIIEKLQYKSQNLIYYKTDDMTHTGTRATGQQLNHLYKIVNPLFVDDFSKCLL